MFLRDHFVPAKPGLTKLLRIMKLTALLLFTACMTASAGVYSQKVTLREKDVPLEKVFGEIKKQTGYVFFYDEAWLKQARKVSIQVTNAPLEEALRLCFTNQPLTFSIIGTTIVIKPKQATIPHIESPPTADPPGEVKGIVRNEKGEPVEGVLVMIKGKKIATTTDANGNFTLKNVGKEDVLVFSSVATLPYEVKVGDKTQFYVSVKNKIDEMTTAVVSTGYQDLRRLAMAGSVSHIKASELYFSWVNTL